MADEKRATPHDVLIARVMDVNRAKSDEEWAAAREIERLRAQLDKPEVAPDDEALIEAHEDAVAERTRLRDVPMATAAFAAATHRWERARAAVLACMRAPQEGWKLVPVEMNFDLEDAFFDAWEAEKERMLAETGSYAEVQLFKAGWKAVLAAAPEPTR